MARYPHELRRDGLFTPTWTLKGTVIAGRYQPPRGDRPGTYESDSLRLEYLWGPKRQRILFQSPFLSRDGDRIQGVVKAGRKVHSVQVSSRGTGAEGVTLTIVAGGFLGRRAVLMTPHGTPLASIRRRGAHFDVDIPQAALGDRRDPAARGRARVYEAAIAMVLAARIEAERHRRAAVGAGAAAAAGAVGAGAAAHHARKKRADEDGPDP